MANTTLQRSTFICYLIHLLGIAIFNPPILYTCHLLTGLSLSLANHTLTSEPVKWLDRTYMAISIPITYYIASLHLLKVSPILPALFYIVGRYKGSVIIHSYSHYMLTGIHLLILYYQ